MSFSFTKIGGTTALLASALMIIGIPGFYYFYVKQPLPIGQPLSQALSSVESSVLPYWLAIHLFQAFFLLLIIPTLWSATHSLKSQAGAIANAALFVGVVALGAASALMVWRGSVEVIIMKVYLDSALEAERAALINLSGYLEPFTQILRSLSLLIVLWALLFLIAVIRSHVFPLWMGLLSLFMIPAVGFFTPAGLAWLIPAGRSLRGAGGTMPKPIRRPLPIRPKIASNKIASKRR